MIDRQQFLVRTRLEIETLEVWIKEEWLIPREDAAGQGIGVILNLIDQVHGLRSTLRDLLQTVRNKTEP